MTRPEPFSRHRPRAGFTLPAVLVVVGALLVLAIGLLLITGIERDTARSFADRERAALAARAGLEEVRGILQRETANDDFLVIGRNAEPLKDSEKATPPYLYIARGSAAGEMVDYRYAPLFSTATQPEKSTGGERLQAPDPAPLLADDKDTIAIAALPWYDPVAVRWIYLKDSKGKPVSRYAYWVEDMQGKIDARIAGNLAGKDGGPGRPGFPSPSSAPLEKDMPALAAIFIGALDPAVTEREGAGVVTKLVIDGRPAMLSPDSIIGATGIGGAAVVGREPKSGLLVDAKAASFELQAAATNRPYAEQPVVPFAKGFSQETMGKPKLNLNKLLADPRPGAVDEFAKWVAKALPAQADSEAFEKRKGGFPAPDDYLKTLAAGALDYADADSDPTVKTGSYVGLDAYPLMSEVVLHIEFQGVQKKGSGYTLNWRMRLFAELWNMTNQPANGSARLSYEVNLQPEPINATFIPVPFDDPSLLDDPTQTTHNLSKIGGMYFGPSIAVSLLPDQYKFYEFADVSYTMDFQPQFNAFGKPAAEKFGLKEPELEARGLTMRWGDQPVQRLASIVRDPFGVSAYFTTQPKSQGKAAIPGHSYGPYGLELDNMGDPRISPYLRTERLAENAYPENLSPNRRNIRKKSIYDLDKEYKRRYYGRVLPSEWPDGGHNSPAGTFNTNPPTDNKILPTDPNPQWPAPPTPIAAYAPQRISNAGRFYSAAELGNVYDPILWNPQYSDLKGKPGTGKTDTAILIPPPGSSEKPNIPPNRNRFPTVSLGSTPSTIYGGGNTLRIGRPEHEKFDHPGQRASQLLDLFHAGMPESQDEAERTGPVVKIAGNVNVNTAGRDALRAMAAGLHMQDPLLALVTDWKHITVGGKYAPATAPAELGTPTVKLPADRIADAILLRRPFASASELASVTDKDDLPVFGNPDMFTEKNLQWTDAAAEETFARVFDASTLRSRNFRVWVIGQALGGPAAKPVPLSEIRKVYTVFDDPGERRNDGSIDPTKINPRVTYENDF